MVQGSLEQACRLQSMAVPSLEMLVQVNKQQETSAFLLALHLLMQIQTDLLHLVCFKTAIFNTVPIVSVITKIVCLKFASGIILLTICFMLYIWYINILKPLI